MVHTQNGGLVVPAPLPSDGGGWLAVFGLLRGAWFADLVRNFLEFFFAASVSYVAISYPLLVEEDFGGVRSFVVAPPGGWRRT
jgi:hypothetical protein